MADKGKRKSYTGEYRLNAVKWFYDNGENVYRAYIYLSLIEKESENGLNLRKLFRNKKV